MTSSYLSILSLLMHVIICISFDWHYNNLTDEKEAKPVDRRTDEMDQLPRITTDEGARSGWSQWLRRLPRNTRLGAPEHPSAKPNKHPTQRGLLNRVQSQATVFRYHENIRGRTRQHSADDFAVGRRFEHSRSDRFRQSPIQHLRRGRQNSQTAARLRRRRRLRRGASFGNEDSLASCLPSD